ncbi:MAG: NAD(P)H-hydrate dehydratase [Bacteroidales bacterium]|nr:NAD(P)H-hydrate dehydratase [Bacteroidales bacterium]
MKILPIEKVKQGDLYTIENEPVSDIDLMERSAKACCKWITRHVNKTLSIKIFCGMGNNGGDGLAIARMLVNKKYKVDVFVLRFTAKMSPSCQINYDRLFNIPNVRIYDLTEEDELPEIDGEDIVIDAILGSGLSKPVKGFIADVIGQMNKNNAIVIAIDVPTGLYCDQSNHTNHGAIVEADFTLTFQFPKTGFVFAENIKYVGLWEVLPIGILDDFIDSVIVDKYYIERKDCRYIFRRRGKFAHKGTFGHALLISGGYGKMGAAVLASKACLRSGTGLLTTHIPVKGYEIMQTAVPEAMVSVDASGEIFSEAIDPLKYNAIGIGPGIGMEEDTQKAFKLLIQNAHVPLLIDADAINILGENKTWLSFIPQNSIFTPHPKEFERLIGKFTNDFERNQLQKEFSVKYHAYVVLKGAHTAITCPDNSCYFNSSGNPGMATGGSGDVLTGVILGLLAQHYLPKEACILAVYVHGLAGDLAAKKIGMDALIAGDIINNLGKAFKKL